MSTLPAPLDLNLPANVLRENDPDPLRIVLWLPGDEELRCRHWRRISGHALGGAVLPGGIRATPVRVTPFREEFRGDVRRLFDRFWAGRGQAAARFILPSGEWVEPAGDARDDALLAWEDAPGTTLDVSRAAEEWPGSEACLPLGPNLVLVLGVTPPAPPPRQAPDPAPKKVERRTKCGPGLPDADFHQDFRARRRRVKERFRQGLHDEAVAEATELLGWARERWFDGHPAVGTCLLVLAVVHHGRGDDGLAERLYREVLDIYCPDLGDNHPNFATGLNNLALLYQARGNYLDAEPLLRQALEIRLGSMGETHALTAASLHNLALVMHGRGDTIAAEALLLRALDVFRRTLGEAHPDVAACLDNLAALYQALGDGGTAGILAGQAHEARLASEGKDLVLVLDTLNLLGELPPVQSECRAVADVGYQAAAACDLAGPEADPFPWLVPAATAPLVDDTPVPAGLAVPPPEGPADATTPPSGAEFAVAPEVVETDRPPLSESAPARDECIPPESATDPCTEEATADAGCPVPEFTIRSDVEEVSAGASDAEPAPESTPAETAETREEAAAPPAAVDADALLPEPADGASYPLAAPILPEESAPAERERTPLPGSPELWEEGFLFDGLEELEEADAERAPEEALLVFTGDEAQAPTGTPELIDDSPAPVEASVVAAEPAPSMPYPVALPVAPEESATVAGNVSLPAEDSAPVGPAAEFPEVPADVSGLLDTEAAATPAVEDLPQPVVAFPHAVCVTGWPLAAAHAECEDLAGDGAMAPAADGSASEVEQASEEPGGEQPPGVQSPAEETTPPEDGGACLAHVAGGRAAEAIALLQRALGRGGSSVLADLPPSGERPAFSPDLTLYLSLVLQYPTAVPGAAGAAYDFVLHRGSAPVAPLPGGEGSRVEVARRLPPGGALVEFVRLRPLDLDALAAGTDPGWLPARYLAFVLPAGEAGDVALLDLGDAAPIDRLVADCRARIADRANDERTGPAWQRPAPRARGPAATAALREAVFDPVATALGDRTRLVLAPTGTLACLPFEVLTHPDGQPLVETHHISYVGSGLDVLHFGAEPAGQPGPAVVAVDPDFDLFLAPGCRPYPSPDGPPGRFPRLAGTRRPGKQFAALLGVEPWVGGAVRKERLLAVRSPHVLHLGTHCVLTDEGAGLALAGANGPDAAAAVEGADCLLSAGEIGQLDLEATELVVLPACDASGADAARGESLLGLCRAFQEAGAAAVVRSHWKVTDWHAKELLADFYQRVLAGEPRSEALRQAQLGLKSRYPDHPEYWGAFVCQGDPGPVRAVTTAPAPSPPRWRWAASRKAPAPRQPVGSP